MATRRRVAPAYGFRPGRLIVVGSGIKSICQFTLEAVSNIESADKVFYCVADPATETFIESHNKTARDLYDLYDDGKPRHQTYTQMAEVILREVRKGFFVVGVFYGHPGVFVNPSHRAIAIAREEGFEAVMLPGVSAEDCLFADLGIDPSRPGCQTLEATDLLLRDRPIATDCHVIIFQVGAVGDLGFNFAGFKNTKFQVLVQRLIKDYGAKHPVVHYVASYMSVNESVMQRHALEDLQRPEIAKRITGISTFYLKPKVLRTASDASATALGLKVLSKQPSYSGPFPSGTPYGEREIAAVKALDTHTTPKNYKKTRTSPALFGALHKLATDPKAQRAFKASPAKFAAHVDNLRPDEQAALTSAHTGLLRMAMKPSADDVAKQFVQAELRNPTLAQQYAATLKANQNDQNGEANIEAWLKSQGYDTTPDAIYKAYLKSLDVELDTFDSTYALAIDEVPDTVLVIQKGTVSVNQSTIQKWTYKASTLTWNASDGNPSSAVLHFQLLSDDDGMPLPAGSYIGPQCYGIYWKSGDSMPPVTNTIGKVGSAPGYPFNPPVQPTPLANFNATFNTYLLDVTGKYLSDSTLIVNAQFPTTSNPTGSVTTITYDGQTIQKWSYSNQTLSWSASDGNNISAAIVFYENTNPTKTNPSPGSQFSGKHWPAGSTTPTSANFFGQIQSIDKLGVAASDAQTAAMWQMIGINLGVGVATMLLGIAVTEAIKAFVKWVKTPSVENKAALDEANDKADAAGENQEAVADEAVEANPGCEPVDPGEVPAQAADVVAEVEVAMLLPPTPPLEVAEVVDAQ